LQFEGASPPKLQRCAMGHFLAHRGSHRPCEVPNCRPGLGEQKSSWVRAPDWAISWVIKLLQWFTH
jgi:hypothetical protein